MRADLDRYYTPRNVAEGLIEKSISALPNTCVDSTCGAGNFLAAADRVLGGVKCVGLDNDRLAINRLRRKRPEWVLSVADVLNENSYKKTIAYSLAHESDLLVLNPPFSHGNRKSVKVKYEGNSIKCSLAMAHILHSFELFQPRLGAIVIVPESVLFSETDEKARCLIGKKHRVEIIQELENTTFSGASVHSTAIKITPEVAVDSLVRVYPSPIVGVSVIRGSLPVHQAILATKGAPYIHSTSIRKLVSGEVAGFHMTEQERKGRISGFVMLIPRVGLPDPGYIKGIQLEVEIQLSDCVIALKATTMPSIKKAECIIKQNWAGFISQYRGTGARYITQARIIDWLRSVGIDAST